MMVDESNARAACRRGRARYRDIAPAVALLTGLALLMGGIIMWRLGYSVDVKIPVTRRAAAAAGTSVKPPPATSAPRRVKVVEAVSAPIAVAIADAAAEPMPTTPPLAPARKTEEVAVAPEAPVVPVKPAKIAPRSRSLASAPQKAAGIECPPAAGSYNVDPTAGDLSATAAMPDRVIYFKHGKTRAASPGDCGAPALAGNAAH
jgi:hypothetical protein